MNMNSLSEINRVQFFFNSIVQITTNEIVFFGEREKLGSREVNRGIRERGGVSQENRSARRKPEYPWGT